MICSALRSLIDECTVILGWCYSSREVADTKAKQERLVKTELAKKFPDFDTLSCVSQPDEQEGNAVDDETAAKQTASSASNLQPPFILITLYILARSLWM